MALDIGNMTLNGMLFPCLLVTGYMIRHQVAINFCERNELIREIENNAFRLLRAYIFPEH